jgi:hypothetical protein
MSSAPISETEARLALDSIDQRRQQVLAEINVPTVYWAAVAASWAALGVLTDYGPAWAAVAATFLFGAVHSAVAPRVISGRRGSRLLSVRGELVSRRFPLIVIGFLVVMTAATVAIALLFDADGARHPAALAGGTVAVIVFVGGPALMAVLRRTAERG